MTEQTKQGLSDSPMCAMCPVWEGECPDCGTFWWLTDPDGKRHGMRPITEGDRRLLREVFANTGPMRLSGMTYVIGPAPNPMTLGDGETPQ